MILIPLLQFIKVDTEFRLHYGVYVFFTRLHRYVLSLEMENEVVVLPSYFLHQRQLLYKQESRLENGGIYVSISIDSHIYKRVLNGTAARKRIRRRFHI